MEHNTILGLCGAVLFAGLIIRLLCGQWESVVSHAGLITAITATMRLNSHLGEED